MLSDRGEHKATIYPRPGLTSPNPYASADLSWADVTEGIELEKEVVVGKWHLWVGNAAVVAYRDHRGIKWEQIQSC